MNNLQAYEDITALKKLREEYERQLKLFNFDLSDLSDDHLSLLNEYATIKLKTKLHDLNKTYLEEYCYTEQAGQIDNFIIIKKLENDIRNLETDIEKENSEIQDLQKFSSLVNSQIVSSVEVEKNEIVINQRIEEIYNSQNKLKIPKDLNVDDLIAKVEILETRNKAK